MTIMKESVVTENGGAGAGRVQDESVTTYFFSSEDTKGAGHSGSNGKASEQTIPQNKVS